MMVIGMRMLGEALGRRLQMQSHCFVGSLLGLCFLFVLYTFELFMIPESILAGDYSPPLMNSFFDGTFITLTSSSR